jgi:hypothetical protein
MKENVSRMCVRAQVPVATHRCIAGFERQRVSRWTRSPLIEPRMDANRVTVEHQAVTTTYLLKGLFVRLVILQIRGDLQLWAKLRKLKLVMSNGGQA